MTVEEMRQKVVELVISREGKNQYSQEEEKRYCVACGYSDCSSLVQWAYQQIGMEIGEDTRYQIQTGFWVTRDTEYPDECLLLPGDLLFFATDHDNGRIDRVGHVEMYMGNGEISGHGAAVGPVRKDMLEYCKMRNEKGKKYIGVKRYIEE